MTTARADRRHQYATSAERAQSRDRFEAEINGHTAIASAVVCKAIGIYTLRFTTTDAHASHAVAMLALRRNGQVVEDLQPNATGVYTVSVRF